MSSYENRRLAELHAIISEIDLAIAELNIEYDNVASQFSGTGRSNGDLEVLKAAVLIEEKIAWLQRERNLAEASTKLATDAAKAEQDRAMSTLAKGQDIESRFKKIIKRIADTEDVTKEEAVRLVRKRNPSLFRALQSL
jgi:hypothetical protein